MEKVRVEELDRHLSTASVKRPVGEALGIEGFALQYYELEPGETFSTNLHTHLDQEEVFYVLEGVATFEIDEETPEIDQDTRGADQDTRDVNEKTRETDREPIGTDRRSIEVAAGEAIRFSPGEYQHGRNDTDERVIGLAMGAPRDSTEGRIECSECGAREQPDVEWTDDRTAILYDCPACGAEINRQD